MWISSWVFLVTLSIVSSVGDTFPEPQSFTKLEPDEACLMQSGARLREADTGSTLALTTPETVLNGKEAEALLNQEGVQRDHAAVVILRVSRFEGETPRFAWQRKTPGYPAKCMENTLCLFGGSKEPSDTYARDTLVRELREELPEAWREAAVESLRPYARFVIQAPSRTWRNATEKWRFVVCVFEAVLPSVSGQAGLNAVFEGGWEVKTLPQIANERFCWAYDTPFYSFLRHSGYGTVVPLPTGDDRHCGCTATRLLADADVGVWEGGEDWQ